FHIGEGKFSSIDWDVQLREHPGQRANVVFVAVGKENRTNMLPVFHQVRNIGDHDVDAQQLRFGKHQAGVDDNNVISPANGHAIHSELAQTAQGHDVQFSSWHL